MQLSKERALPIIKAALKEDIGRGDITTLPLIAKTAHTNAAIITREDCIVCGLEIAEWVMSEVDPRVRFKPNCKDGVLVSGGKELAYLEGSASAILRAERTMLNFLTFLSGVSTRVHRYVNKVKPYDVKILDTRKTIPLLRYLEKYAVFVGGGVNHRMGLYDQVLIKDNHIHFCRTQAASKTEVSLKKIVENSRKKNQRGVLIEIEVATIEDFSDALAGKPDIIMLDNMNPDQVKTCLEIRKMSKASPLIEVSGGITLETIEEFAKTKPDMISIGELTDSVRAIDMSLEFA